MHVAGAVKQNVRFRQLGRELFNLRGVAYIEFAANHLRLFRGESIECRAVNVCRPNGGAFAGKGNRRCPSNSLSSGRDHRGLSSQSSTHPVPPSTAIFDSNL